METCHVCVFLCILPSFCHISLDISLDTTGNLLFFVGTANKNGSLQTVTSENQIFIKNAYNLYHVFKIHVHNIVIY